MIITLHFCLTLELKKKYRFTFVKALRRWLYGPKIISKDFFSSSVDTKSV